MNTIAKIAAAGLLMLGLEGCAGDDMDYAHMPREHGRSIVENDGQNPLQCVPYARDHSSVKIRGDAYTWWDQAAGKYARGSLPQIGAVMVLHDYAGPNHGHVAVVRRLVSQREIRIDHANWLDDGSIYVNDPVMDVSDENDWSRVRVYNIKSGGWGAKIYPVQGFIGAGSQHAPEAAPPDNNENNEEDSPDLVASHGLGATPTAVSLTGEIN